MVRALTFVSDSSNIDAVPSIVEGNRLAHSIGLGAMGLHTFLAKNEIMYGSEESIDFTNVYFLLLNYWTLKASNEIARERQETFAGFIASDYASGKYFDKYLTTDFSPKTAKVKEIFVDIFVPTVADWEELKQAVMKDGLYNQNRLAVAPTGSISYINDTSASLQPIIQKIEERQEKKIGKIYYPASGLDNKTIPYYVSAYDMDMRKMIDVYAAATEHVDQGISMTLYLRSEIPDTLYEWKKETNQTTRDLSILRNYAYYKGIKSIYYVRTFTDNGDEIGANSCESCII